VRIRLAPRRGITLAMLIASIAVSVMRRSGVCPSVCLSVVDCLSRLSTANAAVARPGPAYVSSLLSEGHTLVRYGTSFDIGGPV